ncbi:helix-turn-helix domain-containing protein [Luteimonas viscosa]|uniref:citrate synthase (unknown stereospecificity) n=1 Tax=Luteimonas viscosa TaxID=1132694 RepID=A0A5D4XTZ0_9GAMM|nr:citrate synthase family protein [Luteimonas viscosa]TYT26452.1 helix-turn-helix domain-containing protein [Luteimonas viscosa]
MHTPADAELIPAPEACAVLGISASTLYAYVSRGLIESRPGPDHRSRVYLRRDVERLAQRKQAGRGAARGAAQSLDRGLPVMETAISLIRPDGPCYRGRPAVALVRAGATLEDAARLLWDCGELDPFDPPPAEGWPARVAPLATDATLPPLERAMAAIPLLAVDQRHTLNAAPAIKRRIAATLLRQNAALLVAGTPDARPVHQLLADAWRPGDAAFAELVRAALVLCADHELNVSAFAARVVASTGAHLHATVCAGLAALSGPRHGGATARAYALLADGAEARSPGALVHERWQRGDELPGFHHVLYPDGDPRGAELLAMLRARCADNPRMGEVEALVAAAAESSGRLPNIDGMLAALCHVHGLGPAPALVLFAAGRLAGWLAHAQEQQDRGRLIRPRAQYVGVVPEAADDPPPG